jgi:hypothetical protein
MSYLLFSDRETIKRSCREICTHRAKCKKRRKSAKNAEPVAERLIYGRQFAAILTNVWCPELDIPGFARG